MTIKHKGYVIAQGRGNMILIGRNGKAIFHKRHERKLSEQELKEYMEHFLRRE